MDDKLRDTLPPRSLGIMSLRRISRKIFKSKGLTRKIFRNKHLAGSRFSVLSSQFSVLGSQFRFSTLY